MGISFGSTGRKPYVGSKEVQKAYVGSQLVYTSKPPADYAFIGGENNYFIAEWVNISGGVPNYRSSTTIVKESGIYRLSNSPGDYCSMVINNIPRRVLKFIAKCGGAGSVINAINVYYSTNNFAPSTMLKQFNLTGGADYELIIVNMPTNATKVGIAFTSSTQVWIDTVRFEES